LLDRIDIHVDVPAVKFRELTGDPAPGAESSAEIRERVIHARERQRKRLEGEKIFSNAAMTPRMIRRHCRIDSDSKTDARASDDAEITFLVLSTRIVIACPTRKDIVPLSVIYRFSNIILKAKDPSLCLFFKKPLDWGVLQEAQRSSGVASGFNQT